MFENNIYKIVAKLKITISTLDVMWHENKLNDKRMRRNKQMELASIEKDLTEVLGEIRAEIERCKHDQS